MEYFKNDILVVFFLKEHYSTHLCCEIISKEILEWIYETNPLVGVSFDIKHYYIQMELSKDNVIVIHNNEELSNLFRDKNLKSVDSIKFSYENKDE